jgi:hypothetical protein
MTDFESERTTRVARSLLIERPRLTGHAERSGTLETKTKVLLLHPRIQLASLLCVGPLHLFKLDRMKHK